MRRIRLFLLLLSFCLLPVMLPAMGAQDNAATHRTAFEKDATELGAYTLTMDTVTRLFQATHAATEAAKAEPGLKLNLEGEATDGGPTIDQLAGKVASSPKLVSLFAEYSFTPRQFAAASMCMIQTGLAIMAIQSGKTLDEIIRVVHVNPANIKFMQEHSAEIGALAAKYPTQ